MQRLYRSRARRGRVRATIKRADSEAIQIKGPKREENGDNKDRMCRLRARRGRRMETIKRVDTEAIMIEGPRRNEKGDNKESGRRGCRD